MVSPARLRSINRIAWAVGLLALVFADSARGQETDVALMAEPIGYTDVADAFDERDFLDIDVRLGFQSSQGGGPIAREVVDQASSDGRSSANVVEVGRYKRVRNELLIGLRIGLYHDLMLMVGLPIVLGEERELRPREGEPCIAGSSASGCAALLEAMPGGTSRPLFVLERPLTSATRSGLPQIDLGLAWGVSNQFRTPHWPTWVLMVNTSVPTGQVMRPCLAGSGCEPGVSRGVGRLGLESRWSYRYRYMEPMVGIAHHFTWVSDADSDPPSSSEATVGTAVIPWEDRARFQRFEIDVRGSAALISSGRDFSPLFDALGTSTNAYLTAPNLTQLGPTGKPVEFTGLTNVQAHARLGVDLELIMQAARYVRFSLGVGIERLTAHLITGAEPCNAAVAGLIANDGCQVGIYNPVYRPVIDAPGKRFVLDGERMVRLSAAATGQF